MKYFLKFAACFVLLASNSSYAADTYDAATNTVSIALVKVSDTFYANVKVTLGSVVAIGSQAAADGTYDTYNLLNNQLTIPEVVVGGNSYYNVVITVGGVLSVGASCATAAQCSTNNSTSEALYYAPAQYASAIQASYTRHHGHGICIHKPKQVLALQCFKPNH